MASPEVPDAATANSIFDPKQCERQLQVRQATARTDLREWKRRFCCCLHSRTGDDRDLVDPELRLVALAMGRKRHHAAR